MLEISASESKGEISTSTNASPAAGVQVATRSTAAQPSDSANNAALIGGIVGGIFALLLVGGLIAFLVAHNRRRPARPNGDAALQSVGMLNNGHHNNFESLASSPRENNSGSPRNYDALPPIEDVYVKSSPLANRYGVLPQ
jgi:hypothetical protein